MPRARRLLLLGLSVLCFSRQAASRPCDVEHFNFQILYDNFDTRSPCGEDNHDVSNRPGYDEGHLSTFLDDSFSEPAPFRFPTSAELDHMFRDSNEQYADLSWGETSGVRRDSHRNVDTNYLRSDSELGANKQTFGFQSRTEVDLSPDLRLTPTNNCKDTSSLEILNAPAFTSLNEFIESAFEILRESSERTKKTRDPVSTTSDIPDSHRVDKKTTSKSQQKFQRRYFQDFKDISLPPNRQDVPSEDAGNTGGHFDQSSVGSETSEERSHRLPSPEKTRGEDSGFTTHVESRPSGAAELMLAGSVTEPVDQDVTLAQSSDHVMTSGDHSGHEPMRASDLGEPGTHLWLEDMPEHRAYLDYFDLSPSALTSPEDIPVPPVISPSALPSPQDTPVSPVATFLSDSRDYFDLSPSALTSPQDTPVSPIASMLPGTASSSSSPAVLVDSSEMFQNDMFGVIPCVQGFSLDHRGKCRLMIQPTSALHYSPLSRRPRRRRV